MKRTNSVLKYITSYRSNSIIMKNFLVITLIIIVPFMLLFVSTYGSVSRNMKTDAETLVKPYLSGVVASMDNMYSEMKLVTYITAHNNNVSSFVCEDNVENIPDFSSIYDLLSTTTLTYKYIDSVYIYSSRNNYVLSNVYSSELEEFSDRSWLSQYSYLERDEMTVVPRKNSDAYPYYLSFVTPIYSENYVKSGVVVVNVNIETLAQTLIGTEHAGAEVYVLNEYKKLLFSNQPELIYDNFDKTSFVYERQLYAEEHARDYTLYTVKSATSNLEYILIMSLASNYSGKFPIVRMLLFLLLMILVSLGVALFLTLKTFKPIGNILNAIDDPATAKGDAMNNEVRYILDSINKTVNDKRIIEVELEERMQLLNNAYSTALQAQINPHFLYNTLETINFMAYESFHGKNDISTITTSLSKMLRYGLDNENKIVRLSEELEHLKLYITILQMRYHDLCQFVFDIAPDTLDLKIVKLILQPIVENAFQHGVRPKGYGTIQISAIRNPKNLILKIRDNGVGIPAPKLEELKEIIKTNLSLSSKHIGINNVNRRIKMTFGDQYGLYIKSIEGAGTVFTIKLPVTE